MTFLIVLLTGLYEPQTQREVVNCIAHPFEKHVARTNHFTDYAAAVNIVLTYYKCKDDWDDERSRKGYMAARMLKPKVESIRGKYPEKVAGIASNLKRLSSLEQENEQNIDLMAGLFGNIMAEIFAWQPDEWEPSLRKIGFFLGKFIYLMDAYEDFETDKRKNAYNVFRVQRKEDMQNLDTFVKLLLTSMMSECAKSFERLPILMHADILRNVLYSGVWTKYEYNRLKRERKQQKLLEKQKAEKQKADRKSATK